MPLLAAAERNERKTEKPRLVLRFLQDTIYSTAGLLGQVMDISHRSTVLDSLRRMERQELVRHHDFQTLGGITLWGITAIGQQAILTDGEELSTSIFNPSKVSFINLFHYLDMQQVHIAAGKAGWTAFQYVDRHRRKHLNENKDRASEIRPDLIAFNPQGRKGAIEVELTRKAERRYRTEIIPGHVRNLNAKEYEFVLWISKTPQQQEQLYELFQRAYRELKQAGKWFLDIPPTPFKTFQFANMETWPNY